MEAPPLLRRSVPLAAVAALLLFAAGCAASGGNNPAAAASSTPATSTPATAANKLADTAAIAAVTPDASAIALLPASIRTAGTIHAAILLDMPPMTFTDSNGQLVGAEHDLLVAAARALGLHITFAPVQLDEMVPGITSGRYQLAAGSITDIKQREAKVNIIDYADYGQGLAVPAGNPKHLTFYNMCGLPVAGTEGSYQLITILPALSKQCVSQGKPPIVVKAFSTVTSQFLALASGRVDASLLNFATIAYYVKLSHGQLSVASSSYELAPKGVLVSKPSGLTPALQAALETLDANGTLGKILDYWSLPGVALKQVTLDAAAR